MNRYARSLVALATFLLLGGCAATRSELDIPLPAQSGVSPPASQPTAKTVFINRPVDSRKFELKPATPNIPSLDPSRAQDESIKARAIGRKRNGFGMALGDLLLKDGQTVETLTAASIRQAFTDLGYTVLDRQELATDTTYLVDTRIGRFWSWMDPGFAALTLNTDISTDLTIRKGDAVDKHTIVANATGSYQTGMESNWIEVITMALKAYVEELESRIR